MAESGIAPVSKTGPFGIPGSNPGLSANFLMPEVSEPESENKFQKAQQVLMWESWPQRQFLKIFKKRRLEFIHVKFEISIIIRFPEKRPHAADLTVRQP